MESIGKTFLVYHLIHFVLIAEEQIVRHQKNLDRKRMGLMMRIVI
jgi:hypothetical protein